MSLDVFSPAKVNLYLAITGRRADGFHELLSVVAQLAFGDTLRVERRPAGEYSLECDDPEVPLDEANLILRAARLYGEAAPGAGGARFVLQKRIPMGAGLGGGSSNAAAALLALNRLCGQRLDDSVLAALAARLGSDCPLFLQNDPVVMRGRGERLALLPNEAVGRVRGQRLLLFKPPFGISTAWAYGRMAAVAPDCYLPHAQAEAQLHAWIDSPRAPLSELLFNNMEVPAFAKYQALPTLLLSLRRLFGLAARMSGSGSACYALLNVDTPVDAVKRVITDAWGPDAFVMETKIS